MMYRVFLLATLSGCLATSSGSSVDTNLNSIPNTTEPPDLVLHDVATPDVVDLTSINSTYTTPQPPPLSPANYSEFHIGNAANFYSPPVITAVGTVGNVLSFIVMMQPHNRTSSPGIYMAALAVIDLVMIIVGLFQYWCLFNFFPHLVTESHCHGMFFFVNFVANYGVWVIVAMTIERLLVVVFPFKANSWCNATKTKITILSLCVASAAKNFHYLWTADFVYRAGAAQCAFGLVRKGAWVIAWQWVDTALSAIIPFLVILTANCTIIASLNRQRIKMKSWASLGRADADSPEKRKISRDSRSVTAMLIAVSLAFVLLTAPLFLFRTYFNFVDKSAPRTMAIYHLGHHICHKLWYSNNAVNFYIYCLTGKKFRSDLNALFCRRGKATGSTVSRSTSLSSTKRGSLSAQNTAIYLAPVTRDTRL